ncbi:MAG: glycosyltransferase [Deltaproteobacteria bacterium]|nr:glycosyltransferase [Deltaproteobacteria bacterium]
MMTEKSDHPMISVIIPTFNRADLLEQSLRSLVKQSLPGQHYEVIVIDDGSQDHTREICNKMQRALPLRYCYQENSGIAAAKNLGIFLSRAPILFFFDDDDVADEELLREHLKTHREHPQENIAVLGYTTWLPTLKISRVMHFVTDIGHFLFSYSHLKDGQQLDFTYFWGGRSSCKRSLLVKHGVFRQQFRFGSEDIELGYRLSRFGLRVIFNRNAISHMIRPITYDEFCRRCEKQGRSQYVFSQIHSDPAIQKYCMVAKAQTRWQFIERNLEKKVKRVHELESLLKSASPKDTSRELSDELTNLYWWTFNAFKIKGIVEEMNSGNGQQVVVVGYNDTWKPIPPQDVEYLSKKWRYKPAETASKESILVIDPFLPMYDRASGSLRLFHILKSLLRMGYHVTFIARDSLHTEQYLPILREHGIESYAGDQSAFDAIGVNIIAPYLDLEAILKERGYQAVILDFWNLAEYYLPLVRKYSSSSKVIIDSVDIHFLREIREAELKNDEKLKRKALQNREREIAIYRKADRVWVVTPDDKKAIEGFMGNAPIDIIPNVHEKIDQEKTFEETADLLFVGNFNHKPNIDAAQFLCRGIFPAIQKELKDVKLFLVGNNPPESVKALASEHIIVTGYVPDLSPYLSKARISLSPLRYGAGMKGKIGEALSWGLPVVTSSIGAEGMGLVDGRDVLISDEPEQFAAQVARLYRDKEMWNRLSANGKNKVQREWSPDALKTRLEAIFHNAEPSSGRVSIIILTLNQLQYTRECVKSIQKHTPEPHEIIFVDNGSTDGTAGWLRQRVKENPNYRLIENRENLGFSRGCNQGIKVAAGRCILLLNNDVVVTESWLGGMLECINSAPDIGVVGPMTNNISGPQKVVNANYNHIENLDSCAKSFREKNRHRRIPARRIVGFCMLFKRELVEKIGLLDEKFGSGNYEDDDFCLRAALEGHRNIIAGDVFIHHYGSQSFIGNRIAYNSALAKNKKLFNEKWNGIDAQSALGKKGVALKAMEKAVEFYQSGEMDKAVFTLVEGLKHSPHELNLYYTLAEMLLDAKKFKETLSILKEMPADDQDARKLALIGYGKDGLELYEEAQDYADRALLLNPALALALNLKGILTYKKRDKDSAEDLFQKAIAADPSYGEPYTNLGVIKWAAGLKEEALQFLEKGFILSPTTKDIITTYHSAITASGEFSRAERVFQEAKGIYPRDRSIAFLLIDLLIKQGKNEEAMKNIEEAMMAFGVDEGILNAALQIRNIIGPKKIAGKSGEKGAISLCMIVKNEEQSLPGCLSSAEPIVDEMIVVDTGSTDRTREIARAFGAKVYDWQWTGSFAEARNYALAQASGQWILALDADEIISQKDYNDLTRLTKKAKSGSLAYSFVTRNYTDRVDVEGWEANNGDYALEEAGIGWLPSEKTRLFPNDRRIRFANPVHEFVEPSLRKAGMKIIKGKIPIHHYGKLNKEKSNAKGECYYELGKKKLDEMGDDVHALKELAIQASELKKYEEAIPLWQKVISLKPDMPSAFLNMGHAYLELGRYAEALLASTKAMKLDPQMKEAAYNQSLCELCAGDIENVVSTLENLLRKDPEYPPAMGLYGVACFIEGEVEKGIEFFAKIKKMGADCPEVLLAYATKLLRAGRKEFALSLLRAAITSKNSNQAILALYEECKKSSEPRQAFCQAEPLPAPI